MFSMHVPKYHWRGAILTVSYLINMMYTSVLYYNTPLNCLEQYFLETCIPSNLLPKNFGCRIYLHLSGKGQSKLDPEAEK